MADDYSIRARITGDASEFKVAMEGAAASTESNTARIKKSLEEAKAAAAGYAQAIKTDQEILSTGFGSNPAGGGAAIVGDIKARLAESEAGFAAAKTKVAELQAELKGVPAAAAAAASGFGLTEKQLALMAQAVESAARQLKALPAIQEEVAARINASVAEMAAIRKRADAEVAQSAKILGSIQVSGVAESGDLRGQAALTAATEAHVRALQVQQEVQTRQAAVTAEAEAREELLARATTQSTNATVADAEANVQAAVAKEGSAVAALKVADAQEATLSGARKQATAIETANQLIQRSESAVAQIIAEVANQTGLSAEKMATYVKRASTEVDQANAAIRASQLALQEAITSGNEAAIASMAGLQEAAAGAAAGLADLKSQQADIAATQAAAAEAAAEQASALSVVTEVTTAAAERGQNFADVQQEIAASVGKTSVELEATYVRAAAAAREATNALIRDGERLGPAIQQKLPGADAALATLRSQMQQTRIAAAELAAQIKLVELAEAESTPAAQADALAHYELAIQQKGSAVAALEAELAARKLAAAEREAESSSNVARAGFGLLIGSSQGVLFALSRIVASVPALKAVIGAAFPVITAVAFIDILSQMVGKLIEVTAAFQGFGKEEQKRIDDVNRAIEDSFSRYISLRDKIAETHSIGLTGIPKLNVESTEAATKLDDLKSRMSALTNEAGKLQSAINQVDYSKNVAKAPGHALEQIETTFFKRNAGVQVSEKGTYDETEKALTANKEEQRKRADEIDQLETQQRSLKYEKDEAAFHKSIQLQEQAIDKVRELGLAESAERARRAEADFAAGRITQQQKTIDLTNAESERYAIEQRYAAAHDVLQRQLEVKGEVPRYINEEIDQKRAAINHLKELDQIQIKDSREKTEALKKLNEDHLKTIQDTIPQVEESAGEGKGKRAELEYLLAQQEAIQNLTAQAFPEYLKAYEVLGRLIPNVTKEAAKETETEVKRSVDTQYEAWVESGARTARDVQRYWTDIRNQYSVASGDAVTNAAIVAEANRRIAASAKQVHAEDLKVSEEIQKQTELYRERNLEAQKADIQQKYVAPKESLNPFGATPEQKEKQEIGQVDLSAIQSKIAAVQAEMKIEEDANRANEESYQKLVTKKLQLDNEYIAKSRALQTEALKDQTQNYLQYIQQIDQAFLKGTNEWIFSQKRFSVAMMDAWKGIVTSVVQDMEKIVVKFLEGQLKMLIAHRAMAAQQRAVDVVTQQSKVVIMTTGEAEEMGINTREAVAYAASQQAKVAATASAEAEEMGLTITGNEATAAAEKTANATSILGLAKKRYAAVSSNEGINSIPIVGPALAQAAGIAAFAATLAFLDTGGYIPKQGIAMLHPGEVVVNHPVTSMLSNMAARGGVGSTVGGGSEGGDSQGAGGGDVHLHFHNSIQALDSNGFDRVLDNHGKKIIRYVKSEMRSGRFTQ